MNYTINEIPDEAVELSGTEMIPIWQGETKKVSVATLASSVIPVGAVMAFARGTTQYGWLACDGRDTTGTAEELQTHYPALYTYLGNSNVLPAQFDHNRLGDYEGITVEYLDASTSTLSDVTPTSFTNIAYDGEIEVNARFSGNNGIMGAYLNDKYIAFINIYGGGTGSPEYKTIALSVKKGDRLCLVFDSRYTSSTANTWLGSPYVQARYYKQPLYIKAT